MADENLTPTETTEPIQQTEPTVDEMASELARLKAENDKLRKATTNASADASSWKKKYRETQSEAERAEAERAEREASMKAELDEYRSAARVSTYTTKLIGCGYDAKTAESMARSLPDGVGEDFFAGQKAFLEAHKQSAVAEMVGKQSTITSGDVPSVPDFDSMSDAEYYRYMASKK